MTELEELEIKYIKTKLIFDRLFNLPSHKIIEVIQIVMGNKLNLRHYDVIKKIRNDNPNEIELEDPWSLVEISYRGIYIIHDDGTVTCVASMYDIEKYLDKIEPNVQKEKV